MPAPLPPEVLQSLGLGPISAPAVEAPPLPTEQFEPSQVQPTGSPATVLDLASPPQFSLPSSPSSGGAAPVPEPTPSAPDFNVPMTAFGGKQPGGPAQPSAPHPSGPAGPDQQLGRAQSKQTQADIDSLNAVAANRDVGVAKARDDLAANQAFEGEIKANNQVRKAWQDEYTKTHAQKQAYVDSTLKAVDSYKVDQDKYWHDAGVGRHIGWYIAMAMSGIGNTLSGKGDAPNPVIAMLQKKMHDGVVIQLDQRDQLKERNARAEHALDKYDQFSHDKNAQMSLLDAQADRHLAVALRTAAAKAAEPQQQANALAEAAKLETSSAEKAQKAAEFAATNDVSKKQLSVSQQQLGVSQFNAREGQRHNLATEELTEQQRMLEAQKLEKSGKTDEAKLVRERGMGGEVRPVKDASGKVVGSEVGLITTKDGKTWIPGGTEAAVTKLQASHSAATQFVQTLDEILKIGPEWLTNTANSDKKQRLDELMGDLRLQTLAAKNLGVPTGHDIELAEKFIGTPDPTRFRDSLAGLNESRKSVIRDHNVELRTHGLDKDWNPTDLGKQPDAQQSHPQQLQTSLKTKPDENRDRVWQSAYSEAWKSSGDLKAAQRAADQAMAEAGAISPKQRSDIEALKASALKGDADSLAAIEDVARNGGSDTIKRIANETLSEIRSMKQPSEPASSAGPSFDPNGYDPAALINRFYRHVEPTFPQRTRSALNP